MRRRTVPGALALLLPWPWAPLRAAERAAAPRRLGVLLFDSAPLWDFFRRDLAPALARLGWDEGRNLHSDWRFADGDATRLPLLAQALVRDGADALLSRGTPATQALRQATATLPIVTGVGDPVGAGLAASLAAPGGNVTGLSYALAETALKQLELLREMAPGATRLLILAPADRGTAWAEAVVVVERQARTLGWRHELIRVDGVDGLRAALRASSGAGRAAAFVFSFGAAISPEALVRALQAARTPAIFDQRGYVEAGGLMSYRLNWEDQTRSTALQLDKVLRGIAPAQIPFELPTRSELVINGRSARELGLSISAVLRARADEVIQ